MVNARESEGERFAPTGVNEYGSARKTSRARERNRFPKVTDQTRAIESNRRAKGSRMSSPTPPSVRPCESFAKPLVPRQARHEVLYFSLTLSLSKDEAEVLQSSPRVWRPPCQGGA